MTEVKSDKKKRFRPKKLFKKILGGKGKGAENASLQKVPTVDTMPSNYEPPSIATIEAPSPEPVTQQQQPPPAEPKATVRSVMIETPESPSKNTSYSLSDAEWEAFAPVKKEEVPPVKKEEAPPVKKEEVPFDEKPPARAPLTITESHSFTTKPNADGGVEVDMLANTHQHDEDEIMKSPSKDESATEDPSFVVSVTSKSTEPSPETREPEEEGWGWKVLSDGTLEMKEVHASPKPSPTQAEPPPAQAIKTQRTSSSKRSFGSKGSSGSKKKVSDEEEKKVASDDASATKTTRARSLNSLMTGQHKSLSSSRSLQRAGTYTGMQMSKSSDESDHSEIMSDLEKQEQIHRHIRKPEMEEPTRYINCSFEAVPEIDEEDSKSLHCANEAHEFQRVSPMSTVTSPVYSTAGTTGAPALNLLHDDDDDADTTFDLEEMEELEAMDAEDSAIEEDEQEPRVTNVKEILRLKINQIVDDADSPEQLHYYPEQYAPRRIMGRSPESLAAEEHHGTLANEKTAGTVLSFSPLSLDSEDEADDERGPRSVLSSPDTVTDDSGMAERPEYATGLRSVFSEDTATSMTVNTFNTRDTRDDEQEDSDDDEEEDVVEDAGDSFVNFGQELSDMASELVNSGPAVLMEWMDLRPLK